MNKVINAPQISEAFNAYVAHSADFMAVDIVLQVLATTFAFVTMLTVMAFVRKNKRLG